MLTLTRRTLIATGAACMVLPPISVSKAAVQPAILQNDIWCKPEARAFADRLRSEILSGAVADQCIGAHRTADTAKYPLRTYCMMDEVAYDDWLPDCYVDELAASLVTSLADDLERHRVMFARGHPIPLVALDGSLVIDVYTFQPMIRFYIDWNGV